MIFDIDLNIAEFIYLWGICWMCYDKMTFDIFKTCSRHALGHDSIFSAFRELKSIDRV